ncbi:hypothetical protein N7539_005263 [Penicillium diatomitis]|uniref:ABC transporter domain-containing protein n=1 Tax=Penicillium diatomitis TaxID=2819901 RepID=A0A9W9X7U4_9EURO|nr:uncharacterized protein N7539_005263 [Penicillium diatomitis]KAJ5485275.1 hypothetical protein N7539_005263 [Penicillium diatomitis]
MTDTAAGGCGDNRFGPFILISDCRGGFDFTILFESSILNVLPAACFLVLALARLYYLSKQSVKVSSSIFHRITLGTSIAYAAIQVALVVLVTKQHQGEAESVVLVGVILGLVAALGMTALIDLEHFRSIRPSFLVFADEETVLSLRDVRFGWKSSSISDTPSITLDFVSSDTGTLAMLLGPIGCVKLTFLKGLAGEGPVLEGELFITYPDITFCDENAWLSNASIRSNIIGEDAFEFDSILYRTVVNACVLDLDLKGMAAGDESVVGSKGSKLSGGQRQRIAIARAVYARRRIACFDGFFSGLDNATTRPVFDNVFGFNVHHLSEADKILMFGGNGGIAKISRFADLRDDLGQFTLQHEVEATDDHETQATDEKFLPIGEKPVSNAVVNSSLQTTDRAVYKYYFSALGWLQVSVLLFFLVTNAGVNAFRYVWVDIWASSRNNTSNSQVGYWLGLYGLFSVVELASLMAAVFKPYSFLWNIDTGALVARFSQDMRLVDMVLPSGFISTRFPGITTIRAFSWRDTTSIRMISMLDTAQRPYYLLLCIQRWLSLVLNQIAAVIAVLLVGTAISLRTRVQPGLLGIALVMMTDLGRVLSSLVQNDTLLETSLGSISRIKEFAETTPNEENELLA